MPPALKRRWPLTPVVALLTTLLTACAPASAPASAPAVTPTPPEEQVQMELGPGDFDLAEPQVGLSALTAYRATMTMAFEGKQAGQPARWSRVINFVSSNEPAARLWTLDTDEDLPAVEPVGRAEADGADYEIFPGGTCVARRLEPGASSVEDFHPAGTIRGLFGAESTGAETLDGVATEHYTFDEHALLQAGQTKSSGEVWIASEGGYVLRYLETTTAGEDFFGKGMEGTLQREYRLTEINEPLTIELPPECPLGMVDAPVMPDAANVRRDPSMLQYESASSTADVLAFYQKGLPALGWVDPTTTTVPEGIDPERFRQLQEQLKAMGLVQPTLVPSETEGVLVFDQGTKSLSILLSRDGSITTVILSLTRAPQ